jgi:acetyltransferase-like isoleucine patch superfamily enzyme
MRYFLFIITLTFNLIWLPLAQATTNCTNQSEIPESECKTLLSLFNSTQGAGWFDIFSGGWGITNTPCSWAGIVCLDGHVIAIDRQNNGLNGSIPDLTGLTHLETLNLSHNQLQGALLTTHLPNSLQTLSLDNNQLSGTTPDLTNFPQLTTVNLGNNQLTETPPLPPPPVDPGSLQFSESHYPINENENLLTVTVQRTGGNEGQISAHYATQNETATAGSDFTEATGELIWTAGDSSDKTFTITIINDTLVEENETFTVALSDTTHILANTKITIEDDDQVVVVSPSPPVYGPFYAPLCPTNKSTISQVCRAMGNTMPCQITIEDTASISKAIFACDAENQGYISNSTIQAGATVRGGILTGYIINEGTLADFDFRGITLIGGTLSGTIVNNSEIGGWFQDVQLAPNAQISGGKLKGKIKGDIAAPARLDNVEIKAGAKLSGVIIGENVLIGEGVEFGEGVVE